MPLWESQPILTTVGREYTCHGGILRFASRAASNLFDADILRLKYFALDNIRYIDSEGRVEAMQALLRAHLPPKVAGNKK